MLLSWLEIDLHHKNPFHRLLFGCPQNINDTYGHAAGDTVLVTVAQRLASMLRSSDTVARLEGDEFVLIIESIAEREQVVALGQKLMEVLAQNVTLHVLLQDPGSDAAVLGSAKSKAHW